jgi:hypothetical protein
MMSPREKAIKLIEEFHPYMTPNGRGANEYARECALLAIDLLLRSQQGTEKSNFEIYYYKQVKEELKKLEVVSLSL